MSFELGILMGLPSSIPPGHVLKVSSSIRKMLNRSWDLRKVRGHWSVWRRLDLRLNNESTIAVGYGQIKSKLSLLKFTLIVSYVLNRPKGRSLSDRIFIEPLCGTTKPDCGNNGIQGKLVTLWQLVNGGKITARNVSTFVYLRLLFKYCAVPQKAGKSSEYVLTDPLSSSQLVTWGKQPWQKLSKVSHNMRANKARHSTWPDKSPDSQFIRHITWL